ncbi:addiction module antitoxin [Pelistega indica]|uniref:Addiction module antitoxin n=1 Tax=Pelistega indica TaxID=1414851 RepID=V8FVJ1_9BURK|nr:addiction module antidote protein [Pelistega indica]ETD67738.1 addiction module antitoxin [Pelistega indica]
MEKIEITQFDVSDYLDTETVQKEYLISALETVNIDLFFKALGDVAKARGMSQIAKDTGLSRESLYKSFNAKTSPRFDTVNKVLNALNITLTAKDSKAVNA